MTNDELILQKLTEMQNSIDNRFLTIEEKLSAHSEMLHDIKTATNNLIDWAEDVGRFTHLPFGKAE